MLYPDLCEECIRWCCIQTCEECVEVVLYPGLWGMREVVLCPDLCEDVWGEPGSAGPCPTTKEDADELSHHFENERQKHKELGIYLSFPVKINRPETALCNDVSQGEEGFGKHDYFVNTTEWINLDVSHQQLFTLQKEVARCSALLCIQITCVECYLPKVQRIKIEPYQASTSSCQFYRRKKTKVLQDSRGCNHSKVRPENAWRQ